MVSSPAAATSIGDLEAGTATRSFRNHASVPQPCKLVYAYKFIIFANGAQPVLNEKGTPSTCVYVCPDVLTHNMSSNRTQLWTAKRLAMTQHRLASLYRTEIRARKARQLTA
ncbi:hypothetical protein TWF569_005009 [Orbilia oligospora]|nr:hypothetical protein TWF706_009953 [Orbilia oligospora]KAF3149839.1 hypothetical protein TWF569_005009 [Orbilia oligospora]